MPQNSNMKWIVTVLLLSLYIIKSNGDINGNVLIRKPLRKPMRSNRNTRLLGFDSDEDDDGIHLHIWNDLTKQKNFYPNLMRYVEEEERAKSLNGPSLSSISSTPSYIENNSNEIRYPVDSDELLPKPLPQLATVQNTLKNAILHTLDLEDYQKSDQHSFKINKNRQNNNSPLKLDYLSSIGSSYIPKIYETHSNNVFPLKTIASTAKGAAESSSRPTLHEQLFPRKPPNIEYYTNKPKDRPQTVIESIGYEIGGLPKYSGRLLANEPLPQQSGTFKMFEPVPRQIMMPPPRIPEFKPVPPRLKIIPVVSEYLEDYPDHLNREQRPWKIPSQQNSIQRNPNKYHYPSGVTIIPFKLSEAITKPSPIRSYLTKTEQFDEPTTKSYQHYRTVPITNIESFKKARKTNEFDLNYQNTIRTTTENPIKSSTFAPIVNFSQSPLYSNVVYAPPLQQQQHNLQQNLYQSQPSQYQFQPNPYQPQPNQYQSQQIQYQPQQQVDLFYDQVNRMKMNDSTTTVTSITNQNSFFTDYTNHGIVESLNIRPTRYDQPNQENTHFGNDIADSGIKDTNKTLNNARKTLRRYEKPKNDVVKLNMTGFRITNDQHPLNHENSNKLNDEIANTKIENEVVEQSVYNDNLHNQQLPLQAQSIDSVPADSIQLSETYSKQRSNVPLSDRDDSINVVVNWPNNSDATFQVSDDSNIINNNKIDDDHTNDTVQNKFLIAVYGKEDTNHIFAVNDFISSTQNTASIDQNVSYDNDLPNHYNSTNQIQRIDYSWTTGNNNANETTVDKRNVRQQNVIEETKKLPNHRYDDDEDTTTYLNHKNEKNSTKSTNHDKYYNWYANYAEKNEKYGRKVISEHFKQVEIEPNVAWVIVPR